MQSADRLRLAKHRYSRACAAYLRNDPGAVERCQRALAELQALRREVQPTKGGKQQ